jgi:hypothetical protein
MLVTGMRSHDVTVTNINLFTTYVAAMPELPEGVTSGKAAQVFIEEQPEASQMVKTIQADATVAECATHPPGSRAQMGHVYSLSSDSTVLRGKCGSQTPLYPPMYSTSPADAAIPISHHGLILMDVETHP